MASKEGALLRKFLQEYSKLGSRLFRNNVGKSWTGNRIMKFPGTVTLSPGDIVIFKARPFNAGFPKGSSDLLGWTKVKITKEMVGRDVAVFTACEIKTGRLKPTKEQSAFVRTVNNHGGIGLIAYKFSEVLLAITNFTNKGEQNEKH